MMTRRGGWLFRRHCEQLPSILNAHRACSAAVANNNGIAGRAQQSEHAFVVGTGRPRRQAVGIGDGSVDRRREVRPHPMACQLTTFVLRRPSAHRCLSEAQMSREMRTSICP